MRLSKILILLLLTFFLAPLSVNGAVNIENPLSSNTFTELLDKIIDFIFYIGVFGVAPLMIIIAGFFFVTAAGEPEKITRAKQMILWVLIGLLVLFCAKGLITLFKEIVGVEESGV